MTPSVTHGAARAGAYLIALAALLALLELFGGLAAPSGYRLELVVLHLLVVGLLAVLALVLAGALIVRRAMPDTPVLAAGLGLALFAAETPWSLAGVSHWPWFTLAGGLAGLAAGLGAGLLAWPAVVAHRVAVSRSGGNRGSAPDRAAPRRSDREPSRGGMIPEGWYPDPIGDGWRWWDGTDWTEHTGAGAA